MSQPGGRTELSEEEARRVVERIRPYFDEYVSKYDERKYPPGVYEDLLRAFGAPDEVTGSDIRTAFFGSSGILANNAFHLTMNR